MRNIMKSTMIAGTAMAVIIAGQMALTYAFSYHVGEVFSKTAVAVLFYYCICRSVRKKITSCNQ